MVGVRGAVSTVAYGTGVIVPVGVKSNTGGGMINGVAVKMAGVLDGMGD